MFKHSFKRAFAAKLLCVSILMCGSNFVLAHKASDAYLSAQTSTQASGASALDISVSLRDIDLGVQSLDADNNREITWAEVQTATPAITEWLGNFIQIQCANEPIITAWQSNALEARSDGTYVNFKNSVQCSQGAKLSLTYRLLKDLDANHRLFVTGQVDEQQLAAVLGGGSGDSLELRAPSDPFTTLTQFIPNGLYHIATGWDHLAFLLALLLPINVLTSKAKIFRTVTGFTIGHSVTLAMATFGFIPQFSWIEPMIALSIGITALLNFKTIPLRLSAESLALGFGLVHGMGFASIMREASLAANLMPWALGGFNLGVELGQLAAVVLWGLLSWGLSRWQHYRVAIVKGGSSVLLLMSVYWFIQRVA
jgi:HupE / UreJ protein